MSIRAVRLSISMFAFVLVICVVGANLIEAGQQPTTENQANANMQDSSASKPKTRKRAKRRANATIQTGESSGMQAAETQNATGETQNNQSMDANMNMSAGKGRTRHRARNKSQSRSVTEQADLSGTYAGVFDCADAGLAGDTTLIITGNQFTTSDGKSGHITAATTRGYTAVAMQVGEFTMPAAGQAAPSPPLVMSMRARKGGDRLTLTSVPGSVHRCTFTPSSGNTAKRRARRRHAAAATGEPASATQPAEMTPATTETTTPTAPRRRRGRRAPASANMNSNDNSNMNENENTGTGNENMEASPTPTPPR